MTALVFDQWGGSATALSAPGEAWGEEEKS